MGPKDDWQIVIESDLIDSSTDLSTLNFDQEWKREIIDFLKEWFDSGKHVELTSSGSTGRPKMLNFSKDRMKSSALRTNEFFGLQAGDKALLCLPARYVGAKMMLVRSIIAGLQLKAIAPSSDPLQSLSENFDFVAMTPMQVSRSLEKGPNDFLIKNLIIGGAPLEQNLRARLHELAVNASETYGMTETSSHVALRSADSDHFQALEGVSFSVDDSECLIIHDEKLGIEQLQTNDRVKLLDDKSFIWLGRNDWVINSGGIKVQPEQVEKQIASLLDLPFFIAAIPDDKLGQAVALIYESDKDLNEDLIREIEARLSKYEKPRSYLRLSKVRYTSTDKIDRPTSLNLALNV